MKIKKPSGNPALDRDIECEEAIAASLATLVRLAKRSGWSTDEVNNAILSHIQQHMDRRTSDLELVVSNASPEPANDR